MAPRSSDPPAPTIRREDFRRAYRRDHPLALWFAGSVAAVAVAAILAPGSASQSPQSLALSDGLRQVFYLIWCAGGVLSVVGLWRAHFKLEAAGMSLLGGSFLAYASIIIALLGVSRSSWVFLLGIGLGCCHRSWHLATTGSGR